MSSIKYPDLNAVAAFINFSEFAWEFSSMMFEEDPSDEEINSAIFLALEKEGIVIEDKEKLLASISYYMVEGQNEIDGQSGVFLDAPDYESIFEELGIG